MFSKEQGLGLEVMHFELRISRTGGKSGVRNVRFAAFCKFSS